MKTCTPPPRRVEQLFQDLEDGCISGADHAELMDLLRNNPGSRHQYIKHMRFSSLLYAKAEAIAELEGVSPLATPDLPARQLLRSTLVAAAVIALAGYLASFFVLPDPPAASVKAAPDTVWSFAHGGIGDKKKFLPGTVLAVEGGILDVQLESGSQFIVEGPARVKITSPDEIRMPFGRIWVRAKGDRFVVQTQRLRITDLGTEFGVVASDHLDEEVHVAKGRVRIVPNHRTLPPSELTAGQAVRADGVGRLRTAAYDAARFQSELPRHAPYLHWSFDYPGNGGFPSTGLGLSSAPMAVYSLDARDKALEATSAPGRFGGALAIDQPEHFAQANFPGIEGNLARTVAFWIKGQPGSSENVFPLVCWGLPSEHGTKWVLAVNSEGTAMTCGWGGAWAGVSPDPANPMLDGNWHHLGFVFTGHADAQNRPEINFYLDGRPLALRSPAPPNAIDTDCGAKNSWPLTIGTQLWSTPLRPTFNGAIDELFVFRGALDSSQIRHLMEYNRLPSFSSETSQTGNDSPQAR